MTDQQFDRSLQGYLHDGPDAMPDRALRLALDEVRLTRQRRVIAAGGLLMRLTWQFASIAITSLLVLVLGSAWVGGQLTTRVPTAAPPAPTAAVEAVVPRLLAAGTHTTSRFTPPLTYTVPAGWTLLRDEAEDFALGIDALAWAFEVSYDPVATTADARLDPSVGHSAKDLADFVAAHPDLKIRAAPTAITIGGLSGYWAEITGDTGQVNVFGRKDPGEEHCDTYPEVECAGPSVYPTEIGRFAVLDLPGGRTLLIWSSSFAGDPILDPATEIILSFHFGAPGA